MDEPIRERVILLGGKVAGVDCPDCEFRGREIELEAYTIAPVICPNCESIVLTEVKKAQLRQAAKL